MTPGINRVKTWVLIAGLGGLFVLLGSVLGGSSGATWGLGLALLFNGVMYFASDKIAIASTRSKPVSEQEMPDYYRVVRELAQQQGMPMPRLYVSQMAQPNAFATGRNPKNAAVSVTQGILQLLDERELRGVLAHELSHVANRDILVSSIAAAIGTAITFIARMAFWFGGDEDSPLGGIGALAMLLLAPLAAAVIQMAVSRSREYQADESGAYLSKDPEALASALRKLEGASRVVRAPANLNPSEAHLFIVNPLAGVRGRGFISLFSTHPPTDERVLRLEAIGERLRGASSGGTPFNQ